MGKIIVHLTTLLLTLVVMASGQEIQKRGSGISVRMGEFAAIKDGPDLAALKLISQYYLAENLGLPALTDWFPGKISPGFVASWQFKGKRTLHLTLKTDLKWSNGTPITVAEMVANFRGAKKNGRYHLPSFEFLKSVNVDGNVVTLKFTKNVPGILEELCRADGVLASGDWRKTSGPYFVKKFADDKLVLMRNPHFPVELLDGAEPPEEVTILAANVDRVPELFREKKLHVAMNIQVAALPPHDQWAAAGSVPYWGATIVVHYLRISERLPLGARQAVAKAFIAVKNDLVLNEHLHKHDQMIPLGYPGVLSEKDLPKLKIPKKLNCATKLPVKIEYWDGFEAIPMKSGRKLSQILRDELSTSGCKFEVHALDAAAHGKMIVKDEFDVVMDGFVGNARHVDGSWSFLEKARPKIISNAATLRLLNKARHTEGEKAQAKLYKDVHRSALTSFDVVPLFVSSRALFHDPSLDLSKIDPLDLRMRFWMIQGKK